MKTIYQCDFCHVYSEKDVEIVIHEMNCLYNPANRTCFTCKNDTGDGCIKGGIVEADCEKWEEMKY